MSRDIHIPTLSVAINHDSPKEIGRTGRAGVEGLAITSVEKEEEPHFYAIQKKMGRRVEMVETDGLDLHGF